MICDKCGSKVLDNEVYCPVCNSKLNNTDNTYAKEYKNISGKNRKKSLIIFVVIVILGMSFYNSSSGKYIMASMLASSSNYEKAYEMVSELSGDKAKVKQDYYKLILSVKKFQNTEPQSINDKNSDNGTVTKDDYYDIFSKIDSLRENTVFLSDSEKIVYDNLEEIMFDYAEYYDKVEEFKTNLSKALDVYDDLIYYENEGLYRTNEKIEDTEGYKEALTNAYTVYSEILDETFYGYDSILAAIDSTMASLKRGLEKFDGDDEIYYTEIHIRENYPSPYGNGVTINDVAEEMELKIAKKLFNNYLF